MTVSRSCVFFRLPPPPPPPLPAGGMNFLRIWGGGVFLPTAFYDAADAAGVLIFHDMMYTTTSQTHVPHDTVEELLELRYNVRRLGYLWLGLDFVRFPQRFVRGGSNHVPAWGARQ